MDNRAGRMADEIEQPDRRALAVEFGKIAEHPPAQRDAGKGPPCGGVDSFKRWARRPRTARRGDRKSVVEGKRVSVRVDIGGRGIITTKKPSKIDTCKTNVHHT